MLMLRSFGFPAAVAIVALATSTLHAQDKATLVSPSGWTYLEPRAGVEKGFFKSEGLDLEIKLVPGGNDTIQALAGGSAEFSQSSNAQFLSAIANKIPIVAIGVHSNGFSGMLLASPQHANLSSLSDFKGKRLGAQVGTGVHTVLLMAIERAGMKESDFAITNVRVSDMPAAMQTDRFDAVLAWDPQATRIVQSGRGKEAISSRKFEELADVTYPFLILTSEKMLREKPGMVQKYLNGFSKAQAFMREHPQEAVAIYRKSLPAQVANAVKDDELHAQLYGTVKYERLAADPRDMEDLRRTAAFMLKQKAIQAIPDIEKSINMSFARKAAATRN
jgi:ABC-type nitrate/sulfonate/bicarbonate transport system substrate-binding protein